MTGNPVDRRRGLWRNPSSGRANFPQAAVIEGECPVSNGLNNGHLASLNARHAKLDASLAAEMRRPVPDAATVSRLKREKLRLKEEVEAARAAH
jgi:hypothetical protein